MNKKILIGSIIAVAILIGISFTSVVGYQCVKSDFKASPLFYVRSDRAIEKKGNDFTSNYVGKERANNLYIPKKDDGTDKIETFINAIKIMDDNSLRMIANLLYYQLKQSSELEQYTSEDIFQSLMELRDTPDSIIQNILKRRGQIMMTNACVETFDDSLNCKIFRTIIMIAMFVSVFIVTPILIIITYFIPTMLKLKPQCQD